MAVSQSIGKIWPEVSGDNFSRRYAGRQGQISCPTCDKDKVSSLQKRSDTLGDKIKDTSARLLCVRKKIPFSCFKL